MSIDGDIGKFYIVTTSSNRYTCSICGEKIKKGTTILTRYFHKANSSCCIHTHHFNEEIQNEIRIHIMLG